ncbi:hypothetical protein NQ314_011737 [Rhamnusium bicolor]|uniref:PiggyBac transposable element-derived protein domain-containing protein n=1 Tax=Rhamnusium bicolor TaxID=1586634 RepID=A0AAV8XGL2_9CUCU|nr:hypothetical protein NQ314_011737 [Rhamnusium bicolor]
MYWETKADTHNTLVANSMPRNRFEQIHRFLHFNDNTKIDKNDKLYKIRPLTDHINKLSTDCIQPLGKYFSMDEAMEPYYGRHSLKQFIWGRPIRFGFKFWCLTTSNGYLIKFDTYAGAGDKIEGKTLGSSVTEKLCVNFIPKDSVVFVDNYFNSLPLLETFTNNNINCVGTIRSDRIEKAPLPELKKEKRGTHPTLHEDKTNITLTRWHDNSQVTLATNSKDENIYKTRGVCKGWSKQERASVTVEQPSVVNFYNKGMGGVDHFDQIRGLYRSRIRSKQWYWPIFRFCLNGAVVNMWFLYRYVDPDIGLVDFIRRIVLAILSSPPLGPNTGPKSKSNSKVPGEIRYDNKDHWIDKNETQRRCAKCGKCSKFVCLKCNVGLHPDGCFRQYHTK